MEKKYFIIIIPILILVTIGTFFYLKGNSNASIEIIDEIQNTVPVQRGDIEMSISGSGNIQSKLIKELTNRKAGTIVEVLSQEGDKVNKGDKIIELRSITDEDNDSIIESNLQIYEEENELRKLKEDIEKFTVRAPFTGIVGEVNHKKNDEVSKGQDFVDIIDKSTLKIIAPFNKSIAEKAFLGQRAEILLKGNLQKIEGKVTNINTEGYGTENGELLGNVTIELKNEGALVEGLKAQVGLVFDFGVSYTNKIVKLEWKNKEKIKFQMDGKIQEVYIKNGQKVNKDDIIAKIINEDYMKNIEIKEKRLTNKKIKLKDNNSKRELNNIVLAPISGTVVKVNVVEGENIASDKVVAKIADLDNLEITIPVDELNILKVKEEQEAFIKVPAIEGIELKGKVTKIAQIGDVQNGITKYNVTIKIADSDQAKNLRIGMNANVRIVLASRKNVLIVPIACVKKEDDRYFVNVKDENEEVKMVDVQVGLVSNDYAEIISGLKEGDSVVNNSNYADSYGSQNGEDELEGVEF
ncbi:HlyD family efflux transporter periplasmic adaptor subunit [Paramaledivibacter caminithermalis]|jgi:HlyD family secretion protein|uniref:Biotin-lipoyl like n=1 Tax=Paramaledivibacter caminithermalis (strain DSM 15212 / CIP 107654 / DViRD3) TaxID=1121301 RepID=A0A1M6TIV7_PARC5|nr:HlyD family efflux transporter periplasmic adaptor subunit [Paramaledivibacter caminithermalis]SHK56843.1 Biotin-lipoyl like [Paramaledivibacter caminithermalis DSM 15212]